MKLLYCDSCKDVVRLVLNKWRMCSCKSVGGQYNSEGLTATLGGNGRILGIPNPFFADDFKKIDKLKAINHKKFHSELRKFRKKYQYLHNESEAWWGEHKGEWQIFRIKNPKGPRLTDNEVKKRMMKLFKQYKLSKIQIKKNLEIYNNYLASNKK